MWFFRAAYSLFFSACLVTCAFGARAADSPGEALRRQFESAKAALAAGDLAKADLEYRSTVALGLRQLGNLAISEKQFDQATRLLDDAISLAPDDADLRVEDGVAWFRKGDARKAAQLVQAVVDNHPDNARAHNVLGRIDLFQGDTVASIAELKQAVSLQNDFETAYFLGIAYLKAKQTSDAADLFNKLQAAVGESAALHVLFGRAYTIAHYPAPAVAEFRKAVKLDPKYPRAHALLGYASLELNGESFYPQARVLFEQELKIQPDDYLTLVLLGITTTNLRDYAAAEAALLHATRLRPDGADPYLYLGETYTETRRLKQAVEALQKYLALLRDPQQVPRDVSRAYYMLGQDLLRLGRTDEAKTALANSQRYREAKFKYDVRHIFDEQPAAADPDSRNSDSIASLLESGAPDTQKSTEALIQTGMPGVPASGQSAVKPPEESAAAKKYRAFASEILGSSYNDLGVMRAKAGQFAEAVVYFKQAAAWNAALPGLDRNWGLAAYRAENYGDAIAPLEHQLAAHPDDALVRQLLGTSYYMTDNYAKTVDVLRPFLRNPPDDPGLLLAWGTALVRTNQSNDAEVIFRRLLETNAANPSVHLLLGQAYAEEQNYPNAIDEMNRAVKLDPNLPEAHYYIGLVYLQQSDFASAADEFRAELQVRPTDPITQYHLGLALLSQGQNEEAASFFREALKNKPDYELAHFELGRALLQLGDFPGAIENLEAAHKLAPDHDAALFQLSQAYRRAGRVPEAQQAMAAYQKLIEANRQKRRESLEAEKP